PQALARERGWAGFDSAAGRTDEAYQLGRFVGIYGPGASTRIRGVEEKLPGEPASSGLRGAGRSWVPGPSHRLRHTLWPLPVGRRPKPFEALQTRSEIGGD